MILISAFNFLFYFLATLSKEKKYKIILVFLFIITTIVLRALVDNSQLPDYDSYFSVIGKIEPDFSLNIIFTEPYYFQLVNYLNKIYSAEASINIFYFINYLVTTIFFVWLLFVNDINSWKKVLLFSLFYYLFAYILLRNTLAYISVALLFYKINSKFCFKLSYLAFLSHLSSLPALFFGSLKNKIGDFKLSFLMIVYILLFSMIIKFEAFQIYEKFSTYNDSAEFGVSIFHKLYFSGFLVINLFLFFKERKIIYNYTYLPLLITYLILQLSNGVMGYRFSIYLVIYLLMYVNYNGKATWSTNVLNYFSFSLIILSIYSLNSFI
jgi:hypothetical protein